MSFAARAISSPKVGVRWYFERTYELGWYRPEADAIAIPIAGSGLFTFFATPVVVLLLWLGLRRFPLRVRVLAWSDDEIGSSLLWTAVAGVLCYFEVVDLIAAARLHLPLTCVAQLCWITVWILLRAVQVSRALYPVSTEPSRAASWCCK